MKKYLILICTFPFFFFAKSQSASPQVIATAGDYFVGTNMSLSWTLGELITETVTDGTYTLTQGFQQPHYNISSIEEPKNNNNPLGDINIYPNPVADQLNVSFKDMNQKHVTIALIDMNGKILINDIDTFSRISRRRNHSAFCHWFKPWNCTCQFAWNSN